MHHSDSATVTTVDTLAKLLDLHFAGKGNFQRKIYTPLVFLVWYKRFFIDEGQPSVKAA